MSHLHSIPKKTLPAGDKDLLRRATGRFYTPHWMAASLVEQLELGQFKPNQLCRVVDPFCGDGRLLVALIERIAASPSLRKRKWRFELWDNDEHGIAVAEASLNQVIASLQLSAVVFAKMRDSFCESQESFETFDIVLTNPPWDALKPDRRELLELSKPERILFEKELKLYDLRLAELLPNSQPEKKLYGWGTNLSRCGLELALKLLRKNGFCGIVLPSSLLADQVSVSLRRWLLRNFRVRNIDYYPAEVKPFEGVDQACVTLMVDRPEHPGPISPIITRYDRNRLKTGSESISFSEADLESLAFSIPAELSNQELSLLLKFSHYPTLAEFNTANGGDLWLGREIDETGYQSFTSDKGFTPFAKGRNVRRYTQLESIKDFIIPGMRELPGSVSFERVAWRDVSRRSQIRRMVATIIPAGVATGNSLHVGYFKKDNGPRLKALLGILNSLAFEFQLRSRLGTGHVSLGTVRGVHVPDLDDPLLVKCIAPLVDRARSGDLAAEIEIEREIASIFELSKDERAALVNHFSGLPPQFSDCLRESSPQSKNFPMGRSEKNTMQQIVIPNHYSARLSELDLKTAVAVPPGGNWKNIPISVPSKRLQSIRESYAAGGGSRSTYYGRLHPDRPSYTINTYFNRPGNGCHLHFDFDGGQHRVLSEREAARLQSFPDSFVFEGSHLSIHKQIGNAVPPLLSFQIAARLGVTGQYVDLFSGAGGLSLGFKWAGWQPLVSNDIEAPFLATYRRNIHPITVCGDIRQKDVFDQIVAHAQATRDTSRPLFVIGGPPCQGFSTAGNKRTLDDDRNHLFNEFKSLIRKLKPTGFIFENVTGLLNMNKGAVFEMIKKELAIPGNRLTPWILQAEQYGVPQRRTRLVLVSTPIDWPVVDQPIQLTTLAKSGDLFQPVVGAISTSDALSDLPNLNPGEDGSEKHYRNAPRTPYQRLMRSIITPAEFLSSLGWNRNLKK